MTFCADDSTSTFHVLLEKNFLFLFLVELLESGIETRFFERTF